MFTTQNCYSQGIGHNSLHRLVFDIEKNPQILPQILAEKAWISRNSLSCPGKGRQRWQKGSLRLVKTRSLTWDLIPHLLLPPWLWTSLCSGLVRKTIYIPIFLLLDWLLWFNKPFFFWHFLTLHCSSQQLLYLSCGVFVSQCALLIMYHFLGLSNK